MRVFASSAVLACAAFAACPALAQQPSFDCAKAGNPAEHAISASTALSALDRVLADSYSAARSGLSPQGRQRLLDAQRAWLAQRNACGADGACLAAAMQQRTLALRSGGAAHGYYGSWQPISRATLASGMMTIGAGSLSFANGGQYVLDPVRPGGSVYRLRLTGGPDMLACGGEPIGYVAFSEYEPGKMVVNVIWDRAVPGEPSRAAPMQPMANSCSMSFYER